MKAVYQKNKLTNLTIFFGLVMLFWSFSRSLMLIWKEQEISSFDSLANLVLSGARIDIAVLALIMIVPILIQILFYRPLGRSRISAFVNLYLSLLVTIIVFLELETPYYIDKIGTRPNLSILFSFDNTETIFGLLSKSQIPRLAYVSFLSIVSGRFCWKWLMSFEKKKLEITKSQQVLSALVLVVTIYFDLVTLPRTNESIQYVMNHSTINEPEPKVIGSLVSNSLYSIIQADNTSRLPRSEIRKKVVERLETNSIPYSKQH